MIHANELRIGNIYNRIHGKGFTETVIDEMLMAEIFGQSFEYALNDFENIQLTEDWLLRFGFEQWSEGNWKINTENVFDGEYVNYYLPYFSMNIHIGEVIVKYVHQLQNLYFALTGEELTTKDLIDQE